MSQEAAETILELAWIIPLIPLVSAGVLITVGRKLEEPWAGAIGVGSVVAVARDGGVATVDGGIVRIERPLATANWDALRAWIRRHTDVRLEVAQLRPKPATPAGDAGSGDAGGARGTP